MAALEITKILDETVTKITALALGGSGVADVYKGRTPKNNQKRISVNVYPGDPDKSRRPSGTGYQYFEVPVHIRVQYTRTDTVKGANQIESMFTYLDAIHQALNLQRPDDLSQSISGFFLTEVDWDRTDTETGRSLSTPVGIDQTIEGFLTVRWQFWRAQ